MRILVLEDEPKVARLIAKGLQAERFAVDVAPDGDTAIDCLAVTPYDLAILDLMVPGTIDGTGVLRHLRARHKEMPVLMLTARTAVADKVTHFEAGADDYLTKPFAFAELLIRVKALLRRTPAPRTNILAIGDLQIDRLGHRVTRAGKPIRLTAKEYSLLEYLALNTGRVLSRTMIVEHVWDQSFEGLTNIVDVYVRQLRAKVDEAFDTRLIHTVRSVGYSLSETEP
ncbi:MAG TPA: response regulator transcription factor [Candidatus Methylacidiphilales bacterium]